MPTRVPDGSTAEMGLGDAAKQVAEHASTLVRLELELASLELKRKAQALGIGIALGLLAVLLLLYALGFGFGAGAAGLATVMPTWAALLVVTGVLLLLVAILALLAVGRIKKGTPPVPERAIEEAKRTSEALKSSGNGALEGGGNAVA
jgi:protein-S-isoprenylcysteine O-methyltransferase Ste14